MRCRRGLGRVGDDLFTFSTFTGWVGSVAVDVDPTASNADPVVPVGAFMSGSLGATAGVAGKAGSTGATGRIGETTGATTVTAVELAAAIFLETPIPAPVPATTAAVGP